MGEKNGKKRAQKEKKNEKIQRRGKFVEVGKRRKGDYINLVGVGKH